jgi:D-alanyl-D-alanine-carboxypeptidase/D-alanyl-D-alanine-endopeptidase
MHGLKAALPALVLIAASLAAASPATASPAAPTTRSQPAGPAVDAVKIDKYMQERIEADKLPSLSIGIVFDQKLVFARAYGVADRKTGRPATIDTIYRIGSVSKVFTTTLMCILRDKGVVRLDDPVAKYLPPDVRLPTDPRGAPAITLRHLATHTSGLPRVPLNVVAKGDDAYGGYTARQMYEALSTTQLLFPTGGGCEYSNWGMGLLGHVLERAAGEPYETLLKRHICEPLGMTNTTITLSDQQKAIYAPGYKAEDTQVATCDWDLGVLAGAGAIASNVPDLARFLSLQLRAGQADVKPISGGTLTELRTPQRIEAGWDSAIALGWIVHPNKSYGDLVWHNGGTFGHHSFVAFVPRQKFGVIVLTNCGKSVDEVGQWLLQTVEESFWEAAPAADTIPAAEQILDRVVEAIGGVDACDSVHSLVSRGKGTFMGMPITLTEYIAAPCRYYMRMDAAPAVSIEEGTDGRTVWQAAIGQTEILTGDQREMTLRAVRLDGMAHWREQYTHVEGQGVVEFEGRKCYKVVLTPPTGPKEIQYVGVSDNLPFGSEDIVDIPGMGPAPVRQVFEDYQPCGPILRPRRVRTGVGAGMSISVIQIESVDVNVDIPASRFDLPSRVQQLLAASPPPHPAQTRPVGTTRKAEQVVRRPASVPQSRPALGPGHASRPGQSGGQLEIVRARYGAPGNWVDVTQQVRDHVKNGRVEVLSGNELAGDPAYGVAKVLEVEYRLAGKTDVRRVDEGQVLVLPPGPDDGGTD